MPKLFGLTLINAQTTLSLSGLGRSELRVSLVLDPADGDSPAFPSEAAPVSFTWGSFSFYGIFQQYSASSDIGGYPTYNAVITDVSEILNAGTIIADLYNGPALVNNVFNVYGYYESVSFGNSQVNRTGILWSKLGPALDYMCNNAGTYGSPILYRGYTYGLDISEMPTMPAEYRVNCDGQSILETLATVCRDAGYDCFFILDGSNIKIKTLDRNTPYTAGALTTWISSLTGLVSKASVGEESKNEVTSAVLVGGRKNDIVVSTDIYSYWGDDASGNPIIGVSGVHTDMPSEPCEFFTIPALEVSDFLGATTYYTNTIELRAVLTNENMWNTYIHKYKPAVESIFHGLFKPKNGMIKIDGIKLDRAEVLACLDSDIAEKRHIFYNYLKKYAEEYYGKKYVAKLGSVSYLAPSISNPFEIFSHEIADAGYVDGGGAALGLSGLDSVKFESGDGRIMPFAIVNTATDIDIGGIDPKESTVVANKLYTRIGVSNRLVRISGFSYAVCTLSHPMYYRQKLVADDIGLIINKAAGGAIDTTMPRGGAFGNNPLTTYPAVKKPAQIGIAITSDIETYGPWYLEGVPGKVEYVVEESLVPWSYGSLANLDSVAEAKIFTLVGSQTISGSGDVVVVGSPGFSIGDIPQSGGPPLNAIDINYSTSGFTTTYKFTTFTKPHRGAFARQQEDLMRRSNLLSQDARRKAIRNKAKAILSNEAERKAAATRAFRANLENWLKKESPNDVILSQVLVDGNGKYRVGTSTATLEEGINLINTDSDTYYKKTAMTQLSNLFVPFEILNSATTVRDLPKYVIDSNSGAGITSGIYYPYNENSLIEGITSGDTYESYKKEEGSSRLSTATGVRGIGLRGPIVITGYGYGIPYTGAGATSASTISFPTGGTKNNPKLWKSGPVDLLWDDYSRVWTCHDIKSGTMCDNIQVSATGSKAYIYGNFDSTRIAVESVQTIPSGENVYIDYISNNSKMFVRKSIIGQTAYNGSDYMTASGAGTFIPNLINPDVAVYDTDSGVKIEALTGGSSPTAIKCAKISMLPATTGQNGVITTDSSQTLVGKIFEGRVKISATGQGSIELTSSGDFYSTPQKGITFVDSNSDYHGIYGLRTFTTYTHPSLGAVNAFAGDIAFYPVSSILSGTPLISFDTTNGYISAEGFNGAPSSYTAPSGGATIDTECRAALADLITILQAKKIVS